MNSVLNVGEPGRENKDSNLVRQRRIPSPFDTSGTMFARSLDPSGTAPRPAYRQKLPTGDAGVSTHQEQQPTQREQIADPSRTPKLDIPGTNDRHFGIATIQ